MTSDVNGARSAGPATRALFDAPWSRPPGEVLAAVGGRADGFILAEMADPAHTTGAAVGYGYKQLFYEPFLGGGILTALSVPIILSIGSLTFGIASAVATAGFVIWGIVRNRRPSLQARR
jgi:hypothetical protein